MKTSETVYPLAALRTLVLHLQGLAARDTAFTPDALVSLAERLGYIQIDTLHVVHRAHDALVWSRFGSYDLEAYHDLVYRDGKRRLFEGWGHAASLMPLSQYCFHQWRSTKAISYTPAFEEFRSIEGNLELAAKILERVRTEGPLRVGDIEYSGPKTGEWYDWKPPKQALEALFARGDLMVANRVNFHRVYDLRERVLPDWVDTTPVGPDEGRRWCLEQAARALGVFDLRALTFYAYMKATPARGLLQSLREDGTIVEIPGESTGGPRKWLIHRDNLPLLERTAAGEIQAERTTFLAPFDSLFWAWDRDEKLWGFKQLLECYKPAEKRVYGYFCFPILHKDRLVGRFDPKLDRKTGVLYLKALYLEPGVEPDDALVADVAAAMRDFMAWHEARELVIEKSDPAGFGERLVSNL